MRRRGRCAPLKLAAAPAPDSTFTVNPSLVSFVTVSGVCATRRSRCAVSLGTPIESSEYGIPEALRAREASDSSPRPP